MIIIRTYTFSEIIELTGITRRALETLKNNNYFKSIHKKKLSYAIDESDFKLLKRDLDFIKNSYNIKEVSEVLNYNLNYIAKTIIPHYQLKYKIDFITFNNKKYFNKNVIDRIASNDINLIGKKPNLSDKEHLNTAIKVPEGYLSVTDMIAKYNYSRDVFYCCIDSGRLKESLKIKRIVYIKESEFIEILNTLNKSIPIKEIEEMIFKTTGTSLNFTNKVKRIFPNAFRADLLGPKHYRVYKEDLDYFLKHDLDNLIVEEKIKTEKDPYELYSLLTSRLFYPQFSFTISEYKKFVFKGIKNSRSKKMRNKVFEYSLTLEEILSSIPCNINELSDDDIKILLSNFNSRGTLIFCTFLNFYKQNSPNNCKYINNYNNYYSKNEESNPNDEIYTEEEWRNYLIYLTDIDKHIFKAFKKQAYSRIWLYSLLHFIVAWRSSTILDLPNLNELDIDKYTLEWFNDNIFTMTDAQYIINVAKLKFDTTFANKNIVKNHFVVFTPLVIPVALALLIAEQHRRKNNTTLLGSTYFVKSNFNEYFEDNLDGFQNLKANRSLMTYCFGEAVDRVGYSEVAYSLSSTLRSHKVNQYGLAPITEQYIYATNKDGDASKVVSQLQARGVFGWLYKSLISIAYNIENFTQEEVTNAIVKLKDEISPSNLEGLSKFLEVESKNINSVINELLTMEKPKLEELIKNILTGKCSSKIDYTYCIKYNNCPYKTDSTCYCCKYSIPTNYTLSIINTRLKELLNKLITCDANDLTERAYYSHQIIKLMYLIKNAKEEFINFDSSSKEYIDTFLELSTIKKLFDLVKSDKLLL